MIDSLFDKKKQWHLTPLLEHGAYEGQIYYIENVFGHTAQVVYTQLGL